MENLTWSDLKAKVGVPAANVELDRRTASVYNMLKDLSSVLGEDSLHTRVCAQEEMWFPATDQYGRTVLHLAAKDGHTSLVKCLVCSGALINGKDGIGQTPLTLALHYGFTVIAKFLIDSGASVNEKDYQATPSPVEISEALGFDDILSLVRQKKEEEKSATKELRRLLQLRTSVQNMEVENNAENTSENLARVLNINVGDQKNTANILGCINRCPDVYSCHSPGGGDFHNRGYINDSIARVAGHGGFWHVTQEVMKRPTVNKNSFKQNFEDNNYNNNEEAILDYDDGVSIAMIKMFRESDYFPTDDELLACYEEDGNHNKALLDAFSKFELDLSKNDVQFAYQSDILNKLMPLTRWYKESVRFGNGIAIEGVWMLLPPLYCALGKINYRDESFAMTVNSIAKWPLAYRKMYQQNRTVSLDGKRGRNLAGDEWVEGHLVRPVKQYASSQTNFTMLELMSCNTRLLESNRAMYKSREAFDIHNTRKHCKPNSLYDQLRVSQFALREDWFKDKGRQEAKAYSWAEHKCKEDEKVPNKYINVLEKGKKMAAEEFKGFLHRKFPNDMI